MVQGLGLRVGIQGSGFRVKILGVMAQGVYFGNSYVSFRISQQMCLHECFNITGKAHLCSYLRCQVLKEKQLLRRNVQRFQGGLEGS